MIRERNPHARAVPNDRPSFLDRMLWADRVDPVVGRIAAIAIAVPVLTEGAYQILLAVERHAAAAATMVGP